MQSYSQLHEQDAPADAPPQMSQEGVRQGDPLGMFCFCLLAQTALEFIRMTYPEARLVEYADDAYIQVRPAGATAAALALPIAAASLGLEICRDKSFCLI